MSKWLGVIIKGREQLKDEAHSGCSVIHHNDIVEIKKMRHYVNNDKGVTVRKLHNYIIYSFPNFIDLCKEN